MISPKSVLGALATYLKENPDELLRVAKNAAGLRFGVPITALSWLASRANGKKGPRDVVIETVPPGIRFGASLELMHTPLRAAATLYFTKLDLTQESLRIELRLRDVTLTVLDDTADTPVAALLRSGALDLSKPGNLAAYMPKRPPFLVEAADDRVVLDLMKHKKLSQQKARRIVQFITPLLVVKSIETDERHLDVAFSAFPRGVSEAFSEIRRYL
jgi:hypothetical protein